MKETLTIAGISAACGTRAKGEIHVANLPSGESLSLPIQIINGTEDGPRVWINAAIHGNEFNGVVSALELAEKVDPAVLKGAIIVTPIANPLAFYARSRFSVHDGNGVNNGNLGECYPGLPDGPITRQIAYHQYRAVADHVDALFDLHSSGVTNLSRTYSVLKLVGNKATEKRALDMLLATGVLLNCQVDTTGATDEPVPLDGSLDLELMRRGIPAVMIEIGHSMRVERAVIDHAVTGLLNALRFLGMLEGEVLKWPGQVVASSRYIVRCRTSGLVIPLCAPGQHLQKGDLICRVLSPSGDVLEEVLSPREMHVVSLKEDCVALAGERVCFGAS